MGKRRYLIVYDESLCGTDAPQLATCTRAGAENSPHKHFTAWQIEVDDDGNIVKTAVTPSFHKKEVLEIVRKAAEEGVTTQLPDELETLINNTKNAFITLARERDNNLGIKYFVDVRDKDIKYLKMLGTFDATEAGYKLAHAFMLQAASNTQLPYRDLVNESLQTKK